MKKCLLLFCLLVSVHYVFANTTQGSWRWRKNDGSEKTATYLAAENVTPVISTYETLRVRIERYNTADADTYSLNNMKLQYSSTGRYGTWIDVNSDSTTHEFALTASAFVADSTPTTEQLTTRTGYLFVPGRVISSEAAFNYVLLARQKTEFEFVIKPTTIVKFSTTYYFRTDKEGIDSNLLLPTLITAATLPVKLVSFTVADNGNKALLKWTTVNEVNSDHFDVLRSANGQSWQTIASVTAKGNSSTTQNQYEFTDNTPLLGSNYYRLKQYDKDGIATLSDVKTLTLQDVKNIAASIYPNPTAAAINVMIKSYSGSVTASVTNAQGIVMHKEVIAVTAGTSVYKLNINQKMSAGVYYVNLNGSNLSQKLKVIVQ